VPTRTKATKKTPSRPAPAQPAYGKQWIDSEVGNEEDLTCPSGALCRVRRTGPEVFMNAGILSNMDWLTQLVQEEHVDRVEGKKTKEQSDATIDDFFAQLQKEPEKLEKVLNLVDLVVTLVVVQPNIQLPPEDPNARITGQVYTDKIGLEDKFFIMNYAQGGTRDLATFREGSIATLGSMDARLALEGSA
jgi:hypothetical protein